MSHFAEIDENNIVLRVVLGSNDEPDEGYSWLVENLGGRWVKTSYNTRFGVHIFGGTPLRKNFAGPGFIYDEERDAFVAPKPKRTENVFGKPIEWVLNEETCQWEVVPTHTV